MQKLSLILLAIILAVGTLGYGNFARAQAGETHQLYLPVVLNGEAAPTPTPSPAPEELNITADFLGQAVLASCAVPPENYGFTWEQAYTCQMEGMRLVNPVTVGATSRMIVERAWSTWSGDKLTRTYLEYPLPADIQAHQVEAVKFCFQTQYWQPDEVFIHVGSWAASTVGTILTEPETITNTDTFFSDAWANYAEPFYTIDPLPTYYPGAPCTEVTVPVSAAQIQDNVLRWVFRTADEAAPASEGAWGLSNYVFEHEQDVYTDVTLIYVPDSAGDAIPEVTP